VDQINLHIFEELKKIYREKPENYVRKFEDTLAKIEYPIKDASIVTALLYLLDDDAEYMELMFSILHAAEASDDETYSLGVVNALPELWETSPDWLRTIHVRILNSPSYTDTYLHVLNQSDELKRQVAKEIFSSVSAERPQTNQKVMNAISLITV
jgi:immunity protein 30 of polymorphic toxin system